VEKNGLNQNSVYSYTAVMHMQRTSTQRTKTVLFTLVFRSVSN